jgi:osmoprotectant transport system permease protein
MLTILLGIGNPAVELGLALYALLPIVRNTRTGLGAVDPAVVEAARGMGMSPAQVLLRVELPLALPVIVGGLRQATVMVVAIATVGATVGANDLGQPLLEGIRANDRDAIFAGALLVGALGVSADALLAALERGLSRGRTA